MFGGGSRTLNMQAPMKSVPRYHVATINQCFDSKNTSFLISEHSSIIFFSNLQNSCCQFPATDFSLLVKNIAFLAEYIAKNAIFAD